MSEKHQATSVLIRGIGAPHLQLVITGITDLDPDPLLRAAQPEHHRTSGVGDRIGDDLADQQRHGVGGVVHDPGAADVGGPPASSRHARQASGDLQLGHLHFSKVPAS